jgi:hypothetical protein
MTDQFTHSEPIADSVPATIPETVIAAEAIEAAKLQHKKRNKKIALVATSIAGGVGLLAGGAVIVGNIMRGPAQGGPNPVDTQTSESTPTPSATAEVIDASKFDLPANASTEQIGQNYTNLQNAEFTTSISPKELQTEYNNNPDFGQSVADWATAKATALTDAIFAAQYVDNWKSIPSLVTRHDYIVTQCGIRIQASIGTADNPTPFKEQFTLNGAPEVKLGTSADQKIVTFNYTDTNNAATSGVNQTDNSLINIDKSVSTLVVTYVKVGDKLRIADEVGTTVLAN